MTVQRDREGKIMELPLYMGKERMGSIEAAPGDGATAFTLRAPDLPPGLWRITLEGTKGEVLLALTDTPRLHRRLSWQLLSRAGTLRAARASRVDGPASWQAAGPDLPPGAYICPQATGRKIAIPWREPQPFPLTEYFCFASICPHRGRLWVCLSFDGQGRPIF